jgi:hypothetical protein
MVSYGDVMFLCCSCAAVPCVYLSFPAAVVYASSSANKVRHLRPGSLGLEPNNHSCIYACTRLWLLCTQCIHAINRDAPPSASRFARGRSDGFRGVTVGSPEGGPMGHGHVMITNIHVPTFPSTSATPLGKSASATTLVKTAPKNVFCHTLPPAGRFNY